jgi:hypothetical protein
MQEIWKPIPGYEGLGEQISPLAREFGVSIAAACNAATGRTWKTLEMAA